MEVSFSRLCQLIVIDDKVFENDLLQQDAKFLIISDIGKYMLSFEFPDVKPDLVLSIRFCSFEYKKSETLYLEVNKTSHDGKNVYFTTFLKPDVKANYQSVLFCFKLSEEDIRVFEIGIRQNDLEEVKSNLSESHSANMPPAQPKESLKDDLDFVDIEKFGNEFSLVTQSPNMSQNNTNVISQVSSWINNTFGKQIASLAEFNVEKSFNQLNFASRKPMCILGLFYHFDESMSRQESKQFNESQKYKHVRNHSNYSVTENNIFVREALDDLRSRFLFTYRKGFPPIESTTFTSDQGWGCMIRTGQSLLAEAISRNAFGRGKQN